MTTVETGLRRLVEHPRRGLFVITVTCILGLVAVWPVVDEYCVLADDCAQMEISIVQAQHEASTVTDLRRLAASRGAELATLRKQTLVVNDVHEFSSQLVELTRKAGCQLRRVDLGEVQKRKWNDHDHPLKPIVDKNNETPFELRTQRVAISIGGPIDRVQALLGDLHRLQKLMHTQGIQLRPADGERKEVNLDLELLFFDLKRVKKPATI